MIRVNNYALQRATFLQDKWNKRTMGALKFIRHWADKLFLSEQRIVHDLKRNDTKIKAKRINEIYFYVKMQQVTFKSRKTKKYHVKKHF